MLDANEPAGVGGVWPPPAPGMSECCMKKIGFLSFGHWSSGAGSQTRSASDVLLQSIDLAVAAEKLGADGAYFRVHHFARQLASPFPLRIYDGPTGSRFQSESRSSVLARIGQCPGMTKPRGGSHEHVAGAGTRCRADRMRILRLQKIIWRKVTVRMRRPN
jgi:hypothetical protein